MLSVFPAKNEVRAMLANSMISVVHVEEDGSWLLSPFNHSVKSTESCKQTCFSFPKAVIRKKKQPCFLKIARVDVHTHKNPTHTKPNSQVPVKSSAAWGALMEIMHPVN